MIAVLVQGTHHVTSSNLSIATKIDTTEGDYSKILVAIFGNPTMRSTL